MRALLITYHFPPMLGCCSLRTGAVARALAAKGWECDVLTAAIPSDHPVYTLDAETQPSEPLLNLHPISEGLGGRLIQGLRLRRSRPRTSTGVSRGREALPKTPRLTNQLRALAFPDSKASWIPGAYVTVRSLLKRQKFDLIYSFGYPWSCHVVGYTAQGSSGAPWVADYADPWTLNPEVEAFPGWRKRLDFFVESRLLRRANAVVVATPESRTFLGKVFGTDLEKRTHVARVAQFPSSDYNSRAAVLPDYFQIGFTGLFHPARRPYSFYEAAREFAGRSDFRICLAGLVGEPFQSYSRRLGLDPVIQNSGRLGRRQTIELQQSSHVLLSFGWPGGLQVPCKIYEYFAARRPILHIAGDERDPAAALVRKNRRGIVVANQPQDIRDALRTLHGLWLSGKLDEHFDLSPLDEFCLPRSLDGLEEAFAAAIPQLRNAALLDVAAPMPEGIPSQT